MALPRDSLSRRAGAEFLGTGGLVAVVVGSGIAAQNMTADAGLRLFENAAATAAGLAVLILALAPVSGAHFNPVVSIADWLFGRRSGEGISTRVLAAYVPAQLAGGIGGAVLADAMFARPLVHWSTHTRSSGHLWLGEVVATAGLVIVIFALARTHRGDRAPWAVGAYIGAAYWFTSSTSFANPAVTVARSFSNTFAGIAPSSVGAFVASQAVGGAVGMAIVALLFQLPRPAGPLLAATDEEVAVSG
jgi:glycerol uptake facilitator-like aquaporin